MPDMQREWFERALAAWNAGTESHPLLPGRDVTLAQRYSLAQYLASRWPSSPQGLAVKQVMEALEEALKAGFDGSGDYIASYEARVKPMLRDALQAAREAELT